HQQHKDDKGRQRQNHASHSLTSSSPEERSSLDRSQCAQCPPVPPSLCILCSLCSLCVARTVGAKRLNPVKCVTKQAGSNLSMLYYGPLVK
ncbi:MAG: hypothetical protein Q9214_005109, partial [Letrouitia sp. 1 TL-2023]